MQKIINLIASLLPTGRLEGDNYIVAVMLFVVSIVAGAIASFVFIKEGLKWLKIKH
jgi:uncharacterized membrane protein